MKEDGSYHLFFEASAEGMLLADADEKILDANPVACRLLGRTREGLLGTRYWDVFNPSDQQTKVALEEVRETRNFTGGLRLLLVDGGAVPVEATISKIEDETLILFRRSLASEEESRALRESAARYRAMVENAPDLMVIANLDNTFRYFNPAVKQVLGYEPEELIGTFAPDSMHPDDLEMVAKRYLESMNTPGTAKPWSARYRHKDGSYRYLEVIPNNLVDDPDVRGVVITTRDVTERVEAEEKLRESEERFRALVENAQDFIVLADENNVALYVSPSIEQILGYTPEEWIGTVISDYVYPDDLEWGLKKVAESLAVPGPQKFGTFRYRHKGGSTVYLEVIINNRLEDPILRGVLCNCRDVTDRVLAEKELEESEERLARLNRELARSNTDLKQFAYVVSHGLRSPLRGMVNTSRALLEDHVEKLDDEAKGYLRSLENSGLHAQQLVEDILNLSHVTHSPLLRETVDLGALAESIMAERKENWPEREVEFISEEGLEVRGDPGLLRLLMENLLGNAWKYTSKKERARIELGTVRHEGTRAYFVRDDGAGFDGARAGELFEPFRRLHRPSEFQGTGIGLAPVERIVQRHGGEVWAESEEGRGATFYFTLGPGAGEPPARGDDE